VTHPYDHRLPAGPATFKEAGDRQLGAWRPSDVVDCWASHRGVAPSFWIAGAPKLGKTSFLLRLEHLLLARRAAAGERAITVPLYVCCQAHSSLLSFYRGLLARADDLLRVGPDGMGAAGESVATTNDGDFLLRRSDSAALSDLDLGARLCGDLGRLLARFSAAWRPTARLALLVDHPETAQAHDPPWLGLLFAHLRSLLTAAPPDAQAGFCGRERLVVAIAGGRELAESDAEARLFDVLEEVALHPLDWNEVRSLVVGPAGNLLETERVKEIYRVTGGHPWLVQYVMEAFHRTCGGDPRVLETQFSSIVGPLFRLDPACTAVLRRWQELLPDQGVEILAHLALDGHRVSDRDLAQRTNLAPHVLAKRLGRMAELGVLFRFFAKFERYAITPIFWDWFLHVTGAKVFLEEILRLGRAAAAGRVNGIKAFQFLVSLEPEMVVADGVSSRFCRATSLAASISRLRHRTLSARDETDLVYVGDDLVRDFFQDQWSDVWRDYVRETPAPDARCVFRFDDEKLLDFPVELVRHGEDFLGLKLPVFKELVPREKGWLGRPAYHLAGGCLPAGQPLNVLLVAGSFEGERDFDGFRYCPLPLCDVEVAEIVNALGRIDPATGLVVGRIVVLTNSQIPLPAHVDRRPATVGELALALGERDPGFHVFHYSGHYVPHGKAAHGGLLFGATLPKPSPAGAAPGDPGLELFNLSQLDSCLGGTGLRLVFLNGCRTGVNTADPAAYYLGAAPTVLRHGVPVVIAMRWPVADGDGRLFGCRFYEELVRAGSPEVALWRARQRVHAETRPGTLWAAPVMLAR
jgi:DNA-binding Lrp family transcriptional regulator